MDLKNKIYWLDQSGTSCVLKWTWSTTQLYRSVTKSCFHNPELTITPETFDDFHNLPRKIQDRQEMLAGQWPAGCDYCHRAESLGATSDRMTHNALPGLVPREITQDPTALHVTPKIVEIYFTNTCNFSCVYCNSALSSKWAQEIRKFGEFDQQGVRMLKFDDYDKSHYAKMLDAFWKWMDANHQDLYRMNILGGEPLLLNESWQLLDFFDKHPCPTTELAFVTNLGIPLSILEKYTDRWQQLVRDRKLRRVDVMASIDNWGESAEFSRYGLDLSAWETNMHHLLNTDSGVYLGINIAVNCLGIRTMPDLISRWIDWNKKKSVNLYSSRIFDPAFFSPETLPYSLNKHALLSALDLIPDTTWNFRWGKDRLAGAVPIMEANPDGIPEQADQLFLFLDEISRRRNLNWQSVFPWLDEWRHTR